jgi:hypothetical protein
MKRITCIITAFLTFILISVNSFSVYALPETIPKFNVQYEHYDYSYGSRAVYGYIILYTPSTNHYTTYAIYTDWLYRNSDYLTLSKYEDTFYYLGGQNHLANTSYDVHFDSFVWNGYVDIAFFNSNCMYDINTTYQDLKYSIDINNTYGLNQIVASTVNIKIGDEIVYYGSESYFYSLFEGYKAPMALSRDTAVEPPPPTTEAPTIGEGEYDKVQAETSKNILDNVKNIIKSIANLPASIANNIKSFFTDLLNGIITGLNNLKDGIIQGLKDLFIPSDNAFTDIQTIINEKFGFISQIKDMFSSIINATFSESGEAPEFNITIYGQELSIIDWSLYAPYRMIVHGIIIAIAYIGFIMRLIKRIPKIIGGIS